MEASPLLARHRFLLRRFYFKTLSTMAYAIFKTGGKQYRVSEGERVDVERLDLEVGQEATFDQILAVSTASGLRVGDPTCQWCIDYCRSHWPSACKEGHRLQIQTQERLPQEHRAPSANDPLNDQVDLGIVSRI